jgi:hypothetical protein
MGLTINFAVSYPISNGDVVAKLESVRQKCLDLPFAEVSDVQHLLISKKDVQFYRDLQRKYSYPNNTEENLALRNKLLLDRGIDIWTMINIDQTAYPQDHEVVSLDLWAGKGCESMDIILTKSADLWVGRGFTKTQYAEEFVKCHLLVIKALDLLSEAGFNIDVHDEGHYWETRDIKVLGKNINDYTNLLSTIFGTLKTALEKSDSKMTVEAPISQCKNYMK